MDVEMLPPPEWPPRGAELALEFVVLGEPKGAGSKWSGVVTRKDEASGKRVPVPRENGKGFKTFTKDSSGEAGESWRSDVRDAAMAAFGSDLSLLDCPLALEARFFTARPKSHYGTGKNAGVLKPSAPPHPAQSQMPDGSKLTRALEDALNALVWADDKRIVREFWLRDYGRPRAEVRVYVVRSLATGGVIEPEQAALALD
jgi:Holliday junction resolvase RusA-like endonuclease